MTALDAVTTVDERELVEVTRPRLSQWGLPGGQACMVVTMRDGADRADVGLLGPGDGVGGAGLPLEAADELEIEQPGQPLSLRADAPLMRKVTQVIRSGDAASPERLLREHPGLAAARLDDPSARRSHLTRAAGDSRSTSGW